MNSIDPTARQGARLRGAPPLWLFFAIFTISGFSGLIYESIWSHYLKLFLGHAAYAQSLVLIIFMGGLALGSWLTARLSQRIKTPILVYALVEAVIGVIALLFHGVFVTLSDTFYFSLLPTFDAPLVGNLLKWSAAAALILPQSVLLGMTFPLMTTGIVRRYPAHPGGSLSMLYFTNSIGAAIGVLVSGFWLIGTVGLPGTIMTAGLLNIALAIVVFVLVRIDPEPMPEPIIAQEPSSRESGPDRLAVLFFIAAGITGAASFIYEIAWIRMLSLVLGATTHSFELMLSAFITGLAFGGLWIKRRIDAIDDTVRFAGWVQILMGIMAVLTIPLYVQTFDWMAALLSALSRSDSGYNLFTGVSHAIALVVMVPTTFLAGMTLPLFTHVLMRGRQGERAIGRVYASNTLGAIVGVLFAVHIGLPLLGMKSLIAVAAALDVVLGVVLLQRSHRSRAASSSRLSPALVGGALGAVVLGFVSNAAELDPRRLTSGVYRHSVSQLGDDTNVLYYKDGKTATISLSVNDSRITIATNGKPDAAIQMDPAKPPTADEITMVMAAALPLAYKPDARNVANIGLGSGLTTHTLLADEQIERVDTIEIEAAMIEAARGFGERVGRAYADPRSQIHTEDAKTFFSLQNRRYDAIVAEPSNPWVSGVASLFSQEFYRTVQNYLVENGIFVQWLQLYEFDDDLVESVLRALSQNFSDFEIYNTDNTNILIVAKVEGRLSEPAFERVLTGTFGNETARVGLHSSADFFVRKTSSPTVISSLLADSAIPANSDYFPFLDLNAGRARFKQRIATMFYRWSTARLPVLEMLEVASFDFAAVTADPTFQRTAMVENARKLVDTIASNDAGAANVASFGPSLTSLALLRNVCESGDFEQEWLLGLHSLAELSLAFLSPADGRALLDAAYPLRCRARSTDRLNAWFELYQTVASRDAARMAHAAQAVLTHDANDTRRRYAYSAALLGHVASGNSRRALELWNKDGASFGDLGEVPEVALILSLAKYAAALQSPR